MSDARCVLCNGNLEENHNEFVCETCGVLDGGDTEQFMELLMPATFATTLTMREWLTSVLFNPLLPSLRSMSFVHVDYQPEVADLVDFMINFESEPLSPVAALEELLTPCAGGGACAVCLDEMVDGKDACVRLPCEHEFHRACVELWLTNRDTCPICRDSLNQRALDNLV
jgi:hypothetical protein